MDQAHFAVLSAVFFVSFSLESKLSLKDTSFRFISLVSANILFVLMRKNFRGTGFTSLRSVILPIREMDQAHFAALSAVFFVSYSLESKLSLKDTKKPLRFLRRGLIIK
jgi:uncharacterized membrane protein YgaE (UPF0421/DUF939 family)